MKALFTFTIGPVKPLVENGRKTRDLYAGSSILSVLSQQAIEYVGKCGFQVIFPLPDPGKEPNIPNRFVAKIDRFQKEHHVRMANDVSDYVRKEFRDLCTGCLRKIFDEKSRNANAMQLSEKNMGKVFAQFDHFLEIYWLFQEYENDSEYIEAYGEMSARLHAMKSVRVFAQSGEPWGRKCSLYPEFNALFAKRTEGRFPPNSNESHIIDITHTTALRYAVKPKESLCAIALIKRVYESDSSDMDSVRYMVLKKRLYTTGNKALHDRYFTNCDKGESTYIADAVYDLRNNISALDRDNPQKITELTRQLEEEYPQGAIKQALQLEKELWEKRIGLSSYYALIKLDGDSMGDKYRTLPDEKSHTKLSQKICTFAQKARKCISDSGGMCIYAGGEDILGFLPLESLWGTLETLHRSFGMDLGMADMAFTFSAGIAIAHLMRPLKDVMGKVGEAEQDAKDNGKNSFTAVLMKRSGETRSITYEFAGYESLRAIEKIAELLENKEYAKSVVHNCGALLGRLSGKPAAGLVKTLIEQIVSRQNADNPEELLQQMKVLYAHCPDLHNYLDTLDMAGFLAREV